MDATDDRSLDSASGKATCFDDLIRRRMEELSSEFKRRPTKDERVRARDWQGAGRKRGSSFKGNEYQLVLLRRLVDTTIRSEARHVALLLWSQYNTTRIDSRKGRKVTYHEKYRKVDLRGLRLGYEQPPAGEIIIGPVDLRGANLRDAEFRGVSLTKAKFRKANLAGARFENCCLRGASFRDAKLKGAVFKDCLMGFSSLRGCRGDADTKFDGSDLQGADLSSARLARASFRGANLQVAQIIETDLTGADLTRCRVFGTAVWSSRTKSTLQKEVLVTPASPVIEINDRGSFVNATGLIEPSEEVSPVRTDSLEHAHLLHLMLNPDLSKFLETMTAKAVLLLGTFEGEGGRRLDALYRALREKGWVPVKFDFRRPKDRTLKETVLTLAGLSRFVVADLTEARSIPLELMAIVKDYKIPIVPIQQRGRPTFSMFESIEQEFRDRVLGPLQFETDRDLLEALEPAIIGRAEKRARGIDSEKRRKPRLRRTSEFL